MNEEYLRQTKELVTSIQTRFLELGARLYKIHKEKLWEGSYDSYPEFLESARISESQASIFAKVYEYYVLGGGIKEERLAQAGYSNLYQAIPLIEKEGVASAVVKALTLTRSEINDEVREAKHGIHEHTPKDEKMFSFCQCGKLFQVGSRFFVPEIDSVRAFKTNEEKDL